MAKGTTRRLFRIDRLDQIIDPLRSIGLAIDKHLADITIKRGDRALTAIGNHHRMPDLAPIVW